MNILHSSVFHGQFTHLEQVSNISFDQIQITSSNYLDDAPLLAEEANNTDDVMALYIGNTQSQNRARYATTVPLLEPGRPHQARGLPPRQGEAHLRRLRHGGVR